MRAKSAIDVARRQWQLWGLMHPELAIRAEPGPPADGLTT
jgi:hypothetical protein